MQATLLPTTSVNPTEVQPSEKPPQRDHYFDNARAALLLFVIALHTKHLFGCPVFPIDQLILGLVFVVMPGFCFLSGHLSASSLTRPRVARLLIMLLVLLNFNSMYLFEIKYGSVAALSIVNASHIKLDNTTHPTLEALISAADAPMVPFDVLSERNVTWFLLGLIVWRATLPALLLLRWPLAISTLVAVVAPFTGVGASSISTVFGFWPFFVAGHLCSRARIEAVRASIRVRVAFVAALLLIAALAAVPATAKGAAAAVVPTVVCLYGEGFAGVAAGGAVDCSSWPAVLAIVVGYPVCVCALLGFLSLVPRRRIVGLSLAGRLSIYGYLLHPLIVFNPLVSLGTGLLVARIGCAAGAALYVVAFVAVWGLFSSPLARLLCWPCIEPPVARVCCTKDALAGADAAAEAPAPSERALQ